jgi:D-lactate dehydrogenase
MKILAYDIKKDMKFARDMKIEYVELNDLLKKSDIITIHCPYNKSTHHLINAKNIKLIKKDALYNKYCRGVKY